MNDMVKARCYGQRMFSPFRGVMHTVATEWADAATIDGRNWTLYVRGERFYDDLDDLDAQSVTVPDIKYGTWSKKTGFRRAPIRLPTFDAQVREEGHKLLLAVQCHAAQLPFPLADCFELWLLHATSEKPLALIASACDAESCEQPALVRWTPGQRCMAELPEAGRLHDDIARLAGKQPRAQWFERHADGSGTAWPATRQACLPADDFAPLFVDARALDEQQRALLAATLAWQAPSLLQLPGLSTTDRSTYEDAACRHALRLAEQLPLYPCVLDEAAITAALVEARLRRSTAQVKRTQVRALSPYYIEMPDT